MDFGTLLHTANRNNTQRNESSYYKTKFEPPKKESKSKTLSTNIQKFLAKKEEEERQKAALTKQKRNELLAKRDTKANNKIKKMLKVIKSANKSVLDDAVDNNNTAVTMQGPDQPDEDDYGYVSQEASAFYSKMMEKYKSNPDAEKFASSKKLSNVDLSSTKDRVRAAILRQQEEELLPHKRKRKANNGDADLYDEPTREETKKEEVVKKKRPPMPPPLDFTELLKIAEKKQFEPVVIETKKPESVDDSVRPMTKRQRREYEEEKALREARMRRERERANALSGKSSEPQKTHSESNAKQSKNSVSSSMRIPKLSDKLNKSNPPASSSKPQNQLSIPKEDRSTSIVKHDADNKKFNKDRLPKESEKLKTSNINNSKLISQPIKKAKDNLVRSDNPKANVNRNCINNPLQKKHLNNENRPKMGTQSAKPDRANNSLGNIKNLKPSATNQRPSSSGQLSKANVDRAKLQVKSSSPQSGSRMNIQDRKSQPAGVKLSRQVPDGKTVRQFPPSDIQRSRQFPPADVRGPKPFPPADVRGQRLPPKDLLKKQKLAKRRILDDDDSEYDSSLDDFIDDGPDEAGDISQHIRDIFGYDKSKYRDMDDDDRNMESNYSQVMREEFISKKIGILEDLEDMKMEAMEKQKKTQKKRKL